MITDKRIALVVWISLGILLNHLRIKVSFKVFGFAYNLCLLTYLLPLSTTEAIIRICKINKEFS